MSKAKLLQTKQLLGLSQLGYDLLDKKSYLLSRELGEIKTKRKQTEASLAQTSQAITQAYTHLLQDVGLRHMALSARGVTPIHDLQHLKRSIMGVEINTYQRPRSEHQSTKKTPVLSTLLTATAHESEAHETERTQVVTELHERLQDLTNLMLLHAMLIDSEQQLATSLRKTQVRLNALQNVVIPKQTAQIVQLGDGLQEQEREAQGRLRRV